ncbi:MAG: hypothetical protein ACK55W_12345 [Pseudomonadota bacterium]
MAGITVARGAAGHSARVRAGCCWIAGFPARAARGLHIARIPFYHPPVDLHRLGGCTVIIKTFALAGFAVAGFVAADAAMAQACSIDAWNGGPTGTPAAGRPADGVARYSGQCGLRATATAQYVTDTTPAAEPTFRARFYVYTGLATGSAVVYEALNASSAAMIRVTYDRGAGQFVFATTGSTGNVGSITADRWYSIELNWSRSAGNLVATVRGAGATTDSTATVTGVGGTDQIDAARLGWVSGTATTNTRALVFDAYDSRRASAIGRLCRGDANNDGQRNSGDLIQIRNENLLGTLAAGQPDANEDGSINSGDLIIVRNLNLGGQAACTSGV